MTRYMSEDKSHLDVASRLQVLLKMPGQRFSALDGFGAIAVSLGVAVAMGSVGIIKFDYLLIFTSTCVLALPAMGLTYLWRMRRLRRNFLAKFKTQKERLEAANCLTGMSAKQFPDYPIQELSRLLGLISGGCSCSQCGRSARRLTHALVCRRCKVKLSISGYHCPICGGGAYIKTAKQVVEGYFETPEGVFVESGVPRNRGVYGMASGAIANAGVSAIADGIEKLLARLWKLLARFVKWLLVITHRDVFYCSCGETWGVPLAREGMPFPDALPRMNQIPESK